MKHRSVNIRDERTTSDNRVHPVVVTAVVGFVGWLVLAALALGLGALVTNFVVGHSLGHGDLDIARWFAERRTDTWNSLSKVGSYFGETVTVFVVIAIALVVLAFKRAWPQFGLLAIAMAAEGGVYVDRHVRHQPQPSRGAAARGPDPRRQLPLGPHRRRDGALRLAVHHRLVAHPVPLWRGLFLALAIVGPLIVATSRVYRGMHNATDVICGLLIGAGLHHGRVRRRPRRAGRARTSGGSRRIRRPPRRRCDSHRRWPDDLDRSGRARPQEARRGPGRVAAACSPTPASTTRSGSRCPRASTPPKCVREAIDDGADLIFVWGGDGMVQRCIDAVGDAPVVARHPPGRYRQPPRPQPRASRSTSRRPSTSGCTVRTAPSTSAA